MTWLMIIWYAAVATIVQTTAQKIHYAVSPIIGFEQFYLQVKNSRMFDKRNDEESQDVKAKICQAIVGSPLFRSRHQCEAWANSSSPSKLQPIVVQGKRVEERAFSCVCKQRESRNTNQYFVSHEYVIESTGPRRIPGRFIFLGDTVIALAEEPANVQETNRIHTEQTFWNTVYVSWHTKWNSDDVMCRLTTFQKIRLCNSILNAEGYRNLVEFNPETKNIEPQCQRRELRFEYEQIVEKDKTADDNNLYKPVGPVLEWMIPCKAEFVDTRQVVTRYIMRGHQQHDNYRFYVGMGSEDKDDDLTYLESMIGDRAKAEEERAGDQQKQESERQDNQQQQPDEEESEEVFSSRVHGSNVEDLFSFFSM